MRGAAWFFILLITATAAAAQVAQTAPEPAASAPTHMLGADREGDVR